MDANTWEVYDTVTRRIMRRRMTMQAAQALASRLDMQYATRKRHIARRMQII